MTITSTGLTKAAGVAAAAAGTIFIAVQVNHPAEAAFDTETTEWVVRCSAKAVMTVLALAGITGMYLRQHRQAGPLGLVGYLVFTLGYLLLLSVEVVAAAVLPALLDTDPGYVMDVVSAAAGGKPDGDIGGIQVVLNVAGAGLFAWLALRLALRICQSIEHGFRHNVALLAMALRVVERRGSSSQDQHQ